MPPSGRWRPRGSGPVVRPYAVTGGRTEPSDGEVLDLLAFVVATGAVPTDDHHQLSPEHHRIFRMCQQQITVADLAAGTSLPIGVVRVLLADLIAQGTITVVRQHPAAERNPTDVLQEILNGLRAL